MLVICVKTGLTYARKVHREGEIFVITGGLEAAYKNLSSEAWDRKQRRTYSGDVTFRQPTSDEIVAAIRDKKLDPGSAATRKQLSKKQLRIALDYAESKEAKKLKAIQMLKESIDMEIEDAPEEKVEVVKVPKKEAEAPPEKPVEESKKEAEAPPEEPAEKAPEAPEEEPKAEESEKEPEASEEAPEATEGEEPPAEEPKEPKEPVEEPEKKASGKKDKKKS